MNRLRTCAAVAQLACLFTLCAMRATGQSPFAFPPPADATEAMRLQFYAYDRALPLNPQLKPLDANAQRTRFRLDYDSVHDQRVSAIMAVPKRFSAPFPAILLVHGSGGNKDTSYIQLASEALTAQGFVTLSIDTQYHGDRSRPGRGGEIHMPDSYTMRDAWIQSVVDLRRAVDYLESRSDIDKSKIGYMGFSQGAMLGSVLGGVESRVAAFCLAVPGGGLAKIVENIDKYPFIKAHWPVTVTPDMLQRVEEIANVTDPVYFVGRILPRPLLIMVAEHDEIIPPEASKAVVEASHAAPDQVMHWQTGHILNLSVAFPIRDFFVKSFGKRTAVTAAAK